MVSDEKAAEKLYNRLRLIESDEGTYKIAFENEIGALKDEGTYKIAFENGIGALKDEGTYKIAFENEIGALKDVLSPGNRFLAPSVYLRIFGKKFIKDMGFDVDKPKSGTKSKIPRKRIEQIEQYIEEIDDNAK